MSNYSILTNSSSQAWTSISASWDGLYVTGCYSNNISAYNSNTNTWTSYTTSYTVTNVSVSQTGQYQFALDTNWVYYSSNYGVNWTQYNPQFSTSTTGNYCQITGSGSLGFVVATSGYLFIYTLASSISGPNLWIPWPYITAYNRVWANYLGSIIAVLEVYTENFFITSSYYNGTWYSFYLNYPLTGVYSGSNSNIILATNNINQNIPGYGYIIYSNNINTLLSSNTNPVSNFWTQSDSPAAIWSCIASNSTGQYCIACINDGGIFISINYGQNWFQGNAPTLYWINLTLAESFNSYAIVNSTQQFYYSSNIFGTGNTGYTISTGEDLYQLFLPLQYGQIISSQTGYKVSNLDIQYRFASLSSGTSIGFNTNYVVFNYNQQSSNIDLSLIFATNTLFSGTGYTYSLSNGQYTVTFRSSGTISFIGNLNLNYIVQGGGGGQVLEGIFMGTPSTIYSINIGSVGTDETNDTISANAVSNTTLSESTISGSNITTITALGSNGLTNSEILNTKNTIQLTTNSSGGMVGVINNSYEVKKEKSASGIVIFTFSI